MVEELEVIPVASLAEAAASSPSTWTSTRHRHDSRDYSTRCRTATKTMPMCRPADGQARLVIAAAGAHSLLML